MPKQKNNLRYIYKINSSRLRHTNWNLNLTIQEAIKNKEIVTISDNQIIRFINKNSDADILVNEIIKQINKITKQKDSLENRKKIAELYKQKYDLLFIKEYVFVVIDKNKDFDYINNQGFFINGVKYKRLLATNGGVKQSTVIYVSEDIHSGLDNKINNGRNLNKELVPAKLEAYKSLTCSASIPVSDPKEVLVVNDCVTKFTDNVILLDDTQSDYPELEYKNDFPIKLEDSDGYGLILPELSKRWASEIGEDYTIAGFCIRNSFLKGMVFTFDFLDFAEKIAKNYIIKDAWGQDRDIRDVDIIITTSMLKLWDSYNSLEHYIECCKENDYTFSVTKITPKKLENERSLNYQFIQSYNLTDEDIDELIKPTVQEIYNILGEDPLKSILFLKGLCLTRDNYEIYDNDIIDALIVDKRMINDPFTRNKIHNMIKKRINDAKIGVLKVKGNFSIISGDPYSLCQSIFNLKVTGLLKAGKFYSKYWNDKNVDRVVAFRAPMTCHNNIRILNFVNNEEVNYWYRYMDTVTIFNSWDTTTHALNGADKDSDIILTTDNSVLLRNTKKLPSVLCVQKSAIKKVVTEKDLVQSNKDGFGDEIGSTTNKITTMIDFTFSFPEDSEEYKELQYRIICGQNYQQNAIDKMKGILCKKMPKEWYNYYSAKKFKNKDFNLRILADRKPYFFIYNYPYEMKKYKRYIENSNRNCLMRFGVTVKELQNKQVKTEEEKIFFKYYNLKMPVLLNKSTMNRICWKIEKEFDEYRKMFTTIPFNYKILMNNYGYTENNYRKIKKIYYDYLTLTRQYMISSQNKIDKEERIATRSVLKEDFKKRIYSVCSNEYEVCNIIIELCYKNNYSKQFAWDICGKTIIKNLLKKNNYKIQYPILDENGTIEFGGEKFSLHTKTLIDDKEKVL